MAVITDEIAKLVVSNANSKEFIGKNEVKGKSINIKSNSSSETKIKPVIHKKTETKIISNKSNDAEWESF